MHCTWVKIEDKGKEGYVFDGYLSRFPAIKENEGFHRWAKTQFGMTDSIHKNGKATPIGSPFKLKIIYQRGFAYYEHHDLQNTFMELTLDDATFNETFLIADQIYHICGTAKTQTS